MMKPKCKSADGVLLMTGVRVAHFCDQFEDAGEIVMIDWHRSGTYQVYFRDHGGDVTSYPPDCLYATHAGLLREQIERLYASIHQHEKQIEVDSAKICELESTLGRLNAK